MTAQAARPQIWARSGALTREVLAEFGPDAILAVPIAPADADGEVQPRPGTADAAAAYGLDLFDLAAREGAKGSAGEATVVSLPRLSVGETPWADLPSRLAFVGVGDASTTSMRRAGAALARLGGPGGHVVTTLGGAGDVNGTVALAEGVLLASYRPPFTGLRAGPNAPLELVTIVGDDPARVSSAVEDALLAANATLLTRTLAATPSNIKNPQWLADRATELSAGLPGVKATVRSEAWLSANGLNAIVAVGNGSATPPRLVTVEYTPKGHARRAGAGAPGPVVIVGKGITYDTGGISIKPREAMVPMKTDMAGAAAALAAVLAAAHAHLNIRVVAVLPLAENAFGAASYRPGDVVRLVDGTHVEIGNTDAEGRMVLADAMAWARSEYQPRVLVDIATLTGAASLGLGKRHAALFTAGEGSAELRDALVAAGAHAGEPLWPMPLVEEYRAALDSSVADLAHISTDAHVQGGSIIGALFLREFAGTGDWAHLDIAGPARAAKTEHEVTEGASGFGARLLFRWLQGLA